MNRLHVTQREGDDHLKGCMGGHERATVFVIYVQNIPTRAIGNAEEEMKLNNCFTKIEFCKFKGTTDLKDQMLLSK